MFRGPGQRHSCFAKCAKLSQKINLTLYQRQISVNCHESNKWECMVSVTECSAGSCLDGRLWPETCWVKSVSQQCFCTVDNGLFPRCRFNRTQCDKWHFERYVNWKTVFAKFCLVSFFSLLHPRDDSEWERCCLSGFYAGRKAKAAQQSWRRNAKLLEA